MDSKLLDIEKLRYITMEDDDLAKEILLDFLIESKQIISNLKVSIKNKNLEKVTSLSHKLKGSSASVGAISITEFSEKIEKLSKNNELNTINIIFFDFITLYDKTIYMIKNLELLK